MPLPRWARHLWSDRVEMLMGITPESLEAAIQLYCVLGIPSRAAFIESYRAKGGQRGAVAPDGAAGELFDRVEALIALGRANRFRGWKFPAPTRGIPIVDDVVTTVAVRQPLERGPSGPFFVSSRFLDALLACAGEGEI